jgi:aminopeptidase N
MSAASGHHSFLVPGSRAHYAPDLPVRLEHILIDVAVDPKARTLKGTVTQRLRVIAPGQRRLRLDQVALAIEECRVGGKVAQFSVEGNHLDVELAEAPAPGSELELAIRYETRAPLRGIYFTGPDADYPHKPFQVWTQGQDEDSRHWVPTFDYPNQKATSEVIATVPKGFTAISNGALLSRDEVAGGTRFHYKLGTPHVTYLITLAVGEFAAWEDKGPRGLPVQYFVAPGREEDGKRSFGGTPKMIEAFEARIGVPYPYEKYSQVAVQDFIFGGMENTSATTQTDLTLHDARAHLDFSSDSLVAHELAHQWFGDLVTCRDWSHGWLNEGFATFMERVWLEHKQGEGGGADEARYYQFHDLKEHLEEDRNHYRRPIVCNRYIEPIDLFDTHLYHKGGLVLNLLRNVLGEELFWKSIQLYVTRHRGGSVETLDLIRAIEDATGRNLRRFFDEWIFGAGYPELELSYAWHDEKKLAELVIEQKQTGGQESVTENGATTNLFHLPAVIELTLADGKKVRETIELGGAARDRVFLPAASKPVMVRFDPGHFIPKTMKFPRPKELLLFQLERDDDIMGRIEAAHELAKIGGADVTSALGKAAASDRFWGVQAEAASALAEVRSDAALDALIGALKAKHPKARRGIAQALGKFKSEKAALALRKLAEKDESYYVEADATAAWAAARGRAVPTPDPARVEETESFLLAQLEKPAFREVIRTGALRALAELPGASRGERPRATAALLGWTKRGKPTDARVAAVTALGALARSATTPERARVLEAFSQLADEPDFRLRRALVGALAACEATDAIPILERIRALDPDGRVRRAAQTSASALATAGAVPESVSALKAALEKLEEEHRKLRAQVEEKKAGI